jgi:hypothetical protein
MLNGGVAVFTSLVRMILGLVMIRGLMMCRRGVMMLGRFVMTLRGVHVML